MRGAFFDIAVDGVLVYQDPLIGRLDHPARRIEVRLNRRAGALELLRDGQVQHRFPLGDGPEGACRAAAGAYFAAVAAIAARAETLAAA